jgi:hypothetical protein
MVKADFFVQYTKFAESKTQLNSYGSTYRNQRPEIEGFCL